MPLPAVPLDEERLTSFIPFASRYGAAISCRPDTAQVPKKEFTVA
jgi:hypothetical protein